MNNSEHGHLKNVDFSILRYANCWEDADVLLQALNLKGGEQVFCIASAGDNALALLTTNPARVYAVDINPVQLYLTELKQQAFVALAYDELLLFLGVAKATAHERLQLYQKLKRLLSVEALYYWEAHQKAIGNGVIHAGKFERYFFVFRNYLLPMVHGHGVLKNLLAPKSDAEQKQFFHGTWNSRRWRGLMRLFFNRYTLGRYGRDPEFLAQVSVPVADYIIQKSDRHLQSAACTQNYFLHLMLTGTFGPTLPAYLREENFGIIKQNTGRLVLKQAPAEAVLREQPFDAYCFSNMFEYLPAEVFQNLIAEHAAYMPAGAKLAYWNLMVPRAFHAAAPALFAYQAQQSSEATAQDNGFFYNRFILDEKQ